MFQLEMALILCSVYLAQDSLPVHLSVHPVALVDISAGRRVFAFAVLAVPLPLSHIGSAAFPCERAMSVLVTVHEVSHIPVSVLVRVDAFSGALLQ